MEQDAIGTKTAFNDNGRENGSDQRHVFFAAQDLKVCNTGTLLFRQEGHYPHVGKALTPIVKQGADGFHICSGNMHKARYLHTHSFPCKFSST